MEISIRQIPLRRLTLTALVGLLAGVALLYGSTSVVVEVPSPSMRRSHKVSIVLPRSYDRSRSCYSVIYFLHGYSGNHTSWPSVAPLGRYADNYQIICVCPDGGYGSWYLDSPIKKLSQYETFVAVELVGFVDSLYRTHAVDSGRGLIGSSMGGHGALTLLARHSNVFCGAASISGILRLADFPTKWGIAEVLGPYRQNQALWESYSFVGLADKLVGANRWISIDCGKNDFAIGGNRAAHALLTQLNIPHTYYERAGSHTPAYVRTVVEEHVATLARTMLAPGECISRHLYANEEKENK